MVFTKRAPEEEKLPDIVGWSGRGQMSPNVLQLLLQSHCICCTCLFCACVPDVPEHVLVTFFRGCSRGPLRTQKQTGHCHVCMNVYIYIYVCTCTCTYIYIYTYTHMYVYMLMCVHTCIYIHTSVNLSISMDMYVVARQWFYFCW